VDTRSLPWQDRSEAFFLTECPEIPSVDRDEAPLLPTLALTEGRWQARLNKELLKRPQTAPRRAPNLAPGEVWGCLDQLLTERLPPRPQSARQEPARRPQSARGGARLDRRSKYKIQQNQRKALVDKLLELFPTHGISAKDIHLQLQWGHDVAATGEAAGFPRVRAIVLGPRSPLSGCCGEPVIVDFDIVAGALLMCANVNCMGPILHVASFPPSFRIAVWGRWMTPGMTLPLAGRRKGY